MEENTSYICKVVENFVSGLHAAPDSKLLKCSILLVASIMQTYTKFPTLAERWFEIKKPNSDPSDASKKRFPTFDFVHRFINSTIYPPPSEKFTLRYRDILLGNLARLIDVSQHARLYFTESQLCETLLKYPLSLREQEGENRLRRDPVKNQVTTELFTETQEYQLYVSSLNYYLDIMELSKNPDSKNHFLLVLGDFFENLLVYHNINKNSTIVSILYEGLKVIAEKPTLKSCHTLMTAIIANPSFQSMVWCSLLCFKESELTGTIQKAASRVTHKYTLDFIKFIYSSSSPTVQNMVFVRAQPCSEKEESYWFLSNVSQIYSREEDILLVATKMKQCFDTALRSRKSIKRETYLNEESLFYQALVVRLNTFYLYDATENKHFLSLIITIVLDLGGTPLDYEESSLLLALKNLIFTSQLVSTTKKKLFTIDPEGLCFPYEKIPSLLSLPDLKHWIYDQRKSSAKLRIIAKIFPMNQELLRKLLLELYCYKKVLAIGK
ncbi:hypothetical protein KL914_003178 [Ogataea haglerorum]|uniref:Uncharacterized protein n=1 Tax=Ogataea haglerorum TaxID=1937702 RepID=A0ABQ7RG01_9ASCO|nr:hypothetical protein KL914_003178 [Ogataea haglerorum]KAG7764961.1 hypothetical protein KL946_002828 [Ogataea haglerorum]